MPVLRWQVLAYSGIFLTAASQKKLLAVAPAQHPHVHADHATLDYRPTLEQVCRHALSFLCLCRSCSWNSNAGTAAAAVCQGCWEPLVRGNQDIHFTL